MDESFLYEQFVIQPDRQTVCFDYRIRHAGNDYELREILKFPVLLPDSQAVMGGLRALHLALGISYYKIFVAPQIIQPYAMDAAEADFWNAVWQGGLGEFMYLNGLRSEQLAGFQAQDGQAVGGGTNEPSTASALLGIGGGKDSILAGELLKELGVPTTGFVMATGEQLGQTRAVADTMGLLLHVVERQLDRRLLELQEQPGAYKGHIPISLIFGLVGTVLAAAIGANQVIVANEASASIPRIIGDNGAVNHQWSKSFGFEAQLQTYIQTTVSADIHYFSLIRQLTSVAVAKLFSRYPAYFEVFTSDNFVFRIDPAQRPNARWSLESAKSLSSFILLAPWLDETALHAMFGRNFLNETVLEGLFKELLGVTGQPPLDCVGTVDELLLSLNLAVQQAKFADSHLIQVARQVGILTADDWAGKLAAMLRLQSDTAVPTALHPHLSELLAAKLAA